MTFPTALTVSNNPQKVPNKPRNISRPMRYLEISRDSDNLASILSSNDLRELVDRLMLPSRRLPSIVAIGVNKLGGFWFLCRVAVATR